MFRTPAFAADPATAAYYDQRADEYDEWYMGHGLFALRDRPGWDDEVAQMVDLVKNLNPVRTLDVALPGIDPELWQERVLNDGSRHQVYKRYFTAAQLASELDGEPLFDGAWFVAARAAWGPEPEGERAERCRC